MFNYKIKTIFFWPQGAEITGWTYFSVWLKTGSNPPDINRFRSDTGNSIPNLSLLITIQLVWVPKGGCGEGLWLRVRAWVCRAYTLLQIRLFCIFFICLVIVCFLLCYSGPFKSCILVKCCFKANNNCSLKRSWNCFRRRTLGLWI